MAVEQTYKGSRVVRVACCEDPSIIHPEEETRYNGDDTNSEDEIAALGTMHESLQNLALKLTERDKNVVLDDIKHL